MVRQGKQKMKNWITYSEKNEQAILSDAKLSDVSEHIVKKLGSTLEKFFSRDTTVGQRTELIKCALCQLGRKRGKDKRCFKVYANRLPRKCLRVKAGKCRNREWLYDLHWYTENTG